MLINFPNIHLFHYNLQVWRNKVLNNKYHSDLFLFLEFSLFYYNSYLEHLWVIYNNKNYSSLLYILFIAVQNN